MDSENVEVLALCLNYSNTVLENANIWLWFRLQELSSFIKFYQGDNWHSVSDLISSEVKKNMQTTAEIMNNHSNLWWNMISVMNHNNWWNS